MHDPAFIPLTRNRARIELEAINLAISQLSKDTESDGHAFQLQTNSTDAKTKTPQRKSASAKESGSSTVKISKSEPKKSVVLSTGRVLRNRR
jgi:hypothetical protein